MRNLILMACFVCALSACATLTDVGRIALDRAQTVSSALALRDGYVDLKAQIVANADVFSDQERAALEMEKQAIEDFYKDILALSKAGSVSSMFVKADDFLTTMLVVRGSVDRAIDIVQPKINQLNPGGSLAAAQFIGNYRVASMRMDAMLAQNNRAEAVKQAATLIKAAVPIVTGLLSSASL